MLKLPVTVAIVSAICFLLIVGITIGLYLPSEVAIATTKIGAPVMFVAFILSVTRLAILMRRAGPPSL